MTAIEWLVEQFDLTSDSPIIKNVVEQAKEMEKQQIIDAYVAGDVNGVEHMINDDFEMMSPEEYFNNLKV